MPKPKNAAKQRPYRQGQLDSLCGVYASINALRIACRSLPKPPRVMWQGLFNAMLSELDRSGDLRNTIRDGMSKRRLLRCLKVAKAVLETKHRIKLSVTSPWKGAKRLSVKRECKVMSEHLQHPGHSIILSLCTKHISHWSVIRDIDQQWLHLADSDGVGDLKLSAIRLVSTSSSNPSAGVVHIRSRELLLIVVEGLRR